MQARLWLAIVFVLGAAIGATFGYSFAHRSYASTHAASLSEPERRAKTSGGDDPRHRVKPRAEQKMDAVIASAHQEMRKVREKSEADMDALRQKARGEMREFLTPEQQPKFEEFVRKMDEERKKAAGK